MSGWCGFFVDTYRLQNSANQLNFFDSLLPYGMVSYHHDPLLPVAIDVSGDDILIRGAISAELC